MRKKNAYIPTGNEMISIPEIRESDSAMMGITFLHKGYKGMVEIRGNDAKPFLRPYVIVNGIKNEIEILRWERIRYWIPKFYGSIGMIEIEGMVLAPVGERGFIINLKIINKGNSEVTIEAGLDGCWSKSLHEINENKEINAVKYVYESNWNHSIVFDLRSTINLFSFAPIFDECMDVSFTNTESGDIEFNAGKEIQLESGAGKNLHFFWGFGFEEVGAATAAKEMMRKGFQWEYKNTTGWLTAREKSVGDAELDRVMNTNLFFNYFFASGITMDTEEWVLVTSRSPRYYVSAAYWDRDSLLWSFPSILLTDNQHAKRMLDYVFSTQIRNIGVHSRYIDGTVLEPGFELDELCAPIIAMNGYINKTGERKILQEEKYIKGINHIMTILEQKKHPTVDLYETFLQPTDDIILYPYLTYNNVLVWKVFTILAGLFSEKKEFSRELLVKADRVKKAVLEHCVVENNGTPIYAWSVDLEGRWNIYDEPPGSLQLLPYYGFNRYDDPVFRSTVEQIRRADYKYSFAGFPYGDIGCEHAPHPWILSVANSILCGRKEKSRDVLIHAEMDNGIACESIDENTGECTTGQAFATCAGFLAYAIYTAFGEERNHNE